MREETKPQITQITQISGYKTKAQRFLADTETYHRLDGAN